MVTSLFSDMCSSATLHFGGKDAVLDAVPLPLDGDYTSWPTIVKRDLETLADKLRGRSPPCAHGHQTASPPTSSQPRNTRAMPVNTTVGFCRASRSSAR